MLACRGAQREEPFLGALELLLIKGRGGDRRFQRPAGLFQSYQSAIERRDGLVEESAGVGAFPFKPAKEAGECRDGRCRSGNGFVGVMHVGGDLLGAHHLLAPIGQRGLFIRLRPERLQLIDGGAKIVRFRPRGRDPFLQLGDRRRGLLPGAMGVGDAGGFAGEAAEGVEQDAMGALVDHGAVIVLPVDLDQPDAELMEEIDRHRLVVDEGAAPPVLALDAAQDQVALGGDAGLGEERPGRMAARDVEDRRNVALPGSMTDQRAVAAAAQRQRESVEEDRFAGPGLAGKHRQAASEIDGKPVDENDVANCQGDEHVPARRNPSGRLLGEGVADGAAIVLGYRPLLLEEVVGVLVPAAVREVVAEHGGRGLRLVDQAHRQIGLDQTLQRLLDVARLLVFDDHNAEAIDRRDIFAALEIVASRPASLCRRAGPWS